MSRYFTPHEANQTLQLIRPWVREILRIRDALVARRPDLWPSIQKSVGNGGNAELSALFVDFDRLDTLVHHIQDEGVHIKDINTGLFDFPALHEGREIYLCWRYGEEQVEYWHEIHSGFAGRHKIDWS